MKNTTEIIITKERYHQQEEIVQWCRDNFANNGGWGNLLEEQTWWVMSGFGNTHFFFKQEEDATMFALRWL